MKTEEQARKTRCCGDADCGKYIFTPDPGPQDPMVETRGERGRYCIASECMAWRWETDREREKIFHQDTPPDPTIWERVSPTTAIGVWPTYRRIDLRGYCGLAGKP